MSRAEREASKRPRPRDVAGFSEAVAQGVLPSVPLSAPTPGSGVLFPSAGIVSLTSLAKLVVGFVLIAFFASGVLSRIGLPDGSDAVVGGVLGSGLLVLMVRNIRRTGHRILDETLIGYTTSPIVGGQFFASSGNPWSGFEGGTPWDFGGVWVFDRKYNVVSPPNAEVDPPGFYPSPHRPGQWELWTGFVWSGAYRDGPWLRASAPGAGSHDPA